MLAIANTRLLNFHGSQASGLSYTRSSRSDHGRGRSKMKHWRRNCLPNRSALNSLSRNMELRGRSWSWCHWMSIVASDTLYPKCWLSILQSWCTKKWRPVLCTFETWIRAGFQLCSDFALLITQVAHARMRAEWVDNCVYSRTCVCVCEQSMHYLYRCEHHETQNSCIICAHTHTHLYIYICIHIFIILYNIFNQDILEQHPDFSCKLTI